MIDSVLHYVTVSRAAMLPLLVIVLTSVYSLNEQRLALDAPAFNRHTLKEVALSASWMGLGAASFLMIWGAGHGIEVITWRGLLMFCGFAGVLFFAGKFPPWRRWLRRTVPIQRQWSNPRAPTSRDLSEMVAECRRAVRLGADECLRVMPKVIAALEVLAAERQEMERIRAELVAVVDDLRRRAATTLAPDVASRVEAILVRLQWALAHD
ncbi:hypothetical protein FHR47_002312 [Xanthomonas arboricola]|uniref:hypothetical protein n=1 Tax=Xanthomonas cannabis TaxID=1885674 RepID=UPI0016143D32|nr:hypothetical protein [Xanthomonas cannabis]MBB3802064.1 hypothetical protein [Xanthomonas cannabis]